MSEEDAMKTGTRVRIVGNTSGCPNMESVVGQLATIDSTEDILASDLAEGFVPLRLDDPSTDPYGRDVLTILMGHVPGRLALPEADLEELGIDTGEVARETEAAGWRN